MEAGAGGQVCWCLYVGHFLAHQHYQFSAFPSLKDGMMQSSQRGKGNGAEKRDRNAVHKVGMKEWKR